MRKVINFNRERYPEFVTLGKYNYTKAEKSLAEHIHPNRIEICYYDKGSQWFCVDQDRYLVKGGEVFLHFPGELHGSGGFPEGKGQLYWFIIEVPPATRSSALMAGNEIGYLCRELITQRERHFSGKKEIKQLLEEIFYVYPRSGSRQLGVIQIKTIAQRLLLLLLDCIPKKHAAKDSRLEQVLLYIEENISSNITLSELADQCCLSESRFKGFFKEQTGFTPGDYIQRTRIQKALQVLAECPDATVSSVAYQFNFSSPQYLSNVVKKYTGQPPSALKAHRRIAEQLSM